MTDNIQQNYAFGNTHCWRCRQTHRKEDGSTLGSTEQLRIFKYSTYGWRGGTYVDTRHMSVRFAKVLRQVLRELPFGIKCVARGSMSGMKAGWRPSFGRGGGARHCTLPRHFGLPALLAPQEVSHRKRYLPAAVRVSRNYSDVDWVGILHTITVVDGSASGGSRSSRSS